MSVIKDISNKAKKGNIDTDGDVLDITGVLSKNSFILNNETESKLKTKLQSTKNQLGIDNQAPELEKVKPK